MGHGGEFWQNVVHWRREWHFSILSLRTPWIVWKDKKIWHERWTPQLVRCPICSWRRVEKYLQKNGEAEPKWKQHSGVDVSGDESKVWCCKKQYCIGTWNVRSINQGKLEVFKQEMARVNIDVLGISQLKWTGMGEFNSDDHYIYYCGQEALRRHGVPSY